MNGALGRGKQYDGGNQAMEYECIIVGGGFAGLQAAIQMGRYRHSTCVIDKGVGRSTLCRSYHNLLGWPNGVAGLELRRLGRQHAESTGVVFVRDEIVRAERSDGMFTLYGRGPGMADAAHGIRGSGGETVYRAKTVLLATGVSDRLPDIPGLIPCLGLTVYICPDCDGYETSKRATIVLGSGVAGAKMAVTLAYWTRDLTYVNHEQKTVSPEWAERLEQIGVVTVNGSIRSVIAEHDGRFRGVELADGRKILGERGFVAFGGNRVNTELAEMLGAERHENGHILTDPRTKMTTVPGLWAAGDATVHSEQAAIAMGDGIQAAIWIHKELIKTQSGSLIHA
jgi:thioredoxin reductase